MLCREVPHLIVQGIDLPALLMVELELCILCMRSRTNLERKGEAGHCCLPLLIQIQLAKPLLIDAFLWYWWGRRSA